MMLEVANEVYVRSAETYMRSPAAIAHEERNIKGVRSAVRHSHKTKCGMICNALLNGLTDAEVIDHLKLQNLETTIDCVRTLRRDLRKAGYAVIRNSEVIAMRGAF